MLRKLIFLICNFFINNKLILKFKSSKFKTLNYNYDFFNVNFENFEELKEIIFSNKFFKKTYYDEKNYNYHTFNWLNTGKKIGGANIISLTKKHIFNWNKKKYKVYSYIWGSDLIAKRFINLIYNYDFFAVSATNNEKIIIKKIIIKHYFILKLKLQLSKNLNEQSIEISKALLLFKLINNLKTKKILFLIINQIKTQINHDGLHRSINPCAHAEYINNLYEIKNMCLFFDIETPKEIEYQIQNMSSVLNNLFHKDKTIALFNGSNNSNTSALIKINNLENEHKYKNLSNIKNGLAIFESKNSKIFFDVTKPTSKLLSKNLHTGTLSFEISHQKEKIITNCGSIEKRIGKKPEFLRFSAAHSTVILNNTNISELVEKKSYKRIPKIITFHAKEDEQNIIWEGSHDGYKNNFYSIIKRKLIISKKIPKIEGEDSIITTKIKSKKNLFNIRFHLTPICNCSLTNDQKRVLIKTTLNQSWIFESNNKLSLENSIYVNYGKSINKTKQIVISGLSGLSKKTINWKISKIN